MNIWAALVDAEVRAMHFAFVCFVLCISAAVSCDLHMPSTLAQVHWPASVSSLLPYHHRFNHMQTCVSRLALWHMQATAV